MIDANLCFRGRSSNQPQKQLRRAEAVHLELTCRSARGDDWRITVFDSIAIVGATGAVGRLIRDMLQEREFPYERITFLASARSAGSTIEFAGKKHTVQELRPEAFEGIDLAIGSTPDPVAKEFVPWAVERDCVVVDESGYWRMDPKVPLVIPEVNPEAAQEHQGVIAS